MTESIIAAWWRLIGTPIETSARPDEYRSKIAPPTKPRIATSAKGMRYQVGNIAVKAPIGSIEIASLSSLLLPDRAAP